MHELGVIIQIVKMVENIAKENQIKNIDTLVLQIGELSSVIPKYLKDCYPAAIEGTLLQDTKLEIEILPGNCLCHDCDKIFNFLRSGKKCPNCQSNDWELLSGRELLIKEIIVY